LSESIGNLGVWVMVAGMRETNISGIVDQGTLPA
jgi:hypothetical protein